MKTNNATPNINIKEQMYSANIYELLKQKRKQTMTNLLGHNCEVTALPECAVSWFTGLDSILIGKVKVKNIRRRDSFENKTLKSSNNPPKL